MGGEIKMRNGKSLLLAFCLVLTLTSVVSAFGVSTPYWKENPLNMAPGESATVTLVLQNMIGTEDVTLRASFTDDGNGVALLVDENLDYYVPLGRDDVAVPIKINIPEDEQKGGIRNIKLLFTQVATDNSGLVSVVGGFTADFPINIVDVEESSFYVAPAETSGLKMSVFWIWIVSLIVILVIVIIIVLRKKESGSVVAGSSSLGGGGKPSSGPGKSGPASSQSVAKAPTKTVASQKPAVASRVVPQRTPMPTQPRVAVSGNPVRQAVPKKV